MLGIGEGELLIIVLFAFMIFGPDKLPGMGRTLGRALRQFRNAQEGFTEVVQTNIVDPAAEVISDSPKKKPNRNRAAELDEDADLDLPEGEGAERPRRTETFAERKKRLAAEKAAREAEAKQAEAAAAEEAEKNLDPADADADFDVDSDADAAEAAPKPAAPTKPASKPTAADLYSMKRPSRPASATGDGGSPAATREASDERSEERGADGASPVAGGAPAPDETKEA